MLKFLKLTATICAMSVPIYADTANLGRLATNAEVNAWNIDVRPDGLGLPVGSGSVAEGEEIFSEKCAACHGDFGEAVDRWPVLAGGQGTLTDDRPVKTVGSYWPYLSTVYDYVYRAMPFGNAQSLSPDEVYALVAYILYVNDTVDDEEFILSNTNFLDMPQENSKGFFMDDRAMVEYPIFTREVCMSNCKQTAEVILRAAVIDVTPEETAAKAIEAKTKSEIEINLDNELIVEPNIEILNQELVTAGAKVFKKCKACHKVGEKAKNGTGPLLNEIYLADGAQVEKFKYSKVLRSASENGLVWDDVTLRAFLTKPKKFLKGTKMSFSGLKKDKDLDAIIEFLKFYSQ